MSEKSGTDIKKVKELIQLMIDNDLVEVKIESGDDKISLKRPQANMPMITQVPMAAPVAAAAPAAAPVAPASASTEDDGLVEISSPMVGTFYSSPSPDSESFVEVGSIVKSDSVVCIIEAMKVMNEIKAELSGTIVEILCKPGEAVEFGQALFKVKP